MLAGEFWSLKSINLKGATFGDLCTRGTSANWKKDRRADTCTFFLIVQVDPFTVLVWSCPIMLRLLPLWDANPQRHRKWEFSTSGENSKNYQRQVLREVESSPYGTIARMLQGIHIYLPLPLILLFVCIFHSPSIAQSWWHDFLPFWVRKFTRPFIFKYYLENQRTI